MLVEKISANNSSYPMQKAIYYSTTESRKNSKFNIIENTVAIHQKPKEPILLKVLADYLDYFILLR